MLLTFVCLCAVASCARAIVCPPDYCSMAKCTQLTAENCQGTIKANGGFCGCCDSCITELAIGENCIPLVFFGVPATTQCVTGSMCDPATHTCKAIAPPAKRELSAGPCYVKLQEHNHMLAAAGGMLLGAEKPNCDADGNFAGMQFAGSQAYCVTKNGTSIPSYSVNRWETGKDMNCQCARDLYAYMATGLIGKLFHCAPNGNYATAKRELSAGPCYAKLQEHNHMLAAAGGMLMGAEKPNCDTDGNFAGMQFAGSQAYCVTKNGTSIQSYSVNRWETGKDMNCQCARDLYAYMATGLIGKLFHCAPNGNYADTQCMGDVCYCVDKDGNQVGTTNVHMTQLGSLNC